MINLFNIKSEVVNPCLFALTTECQPKIQKTLLLLEPNLPCTGHVKFKKMQYLFQFQWHFILNLYDMNNMLFPEHENSFSTSMINLHFCFAKKLTFLLGICKSISHNSTMPCSSRKQQN